MSRPCPAYLRYGILILIAPPRPAPREPCVQPFQLPCATAFFLSHRARACSHIAHTYDISYCVRMNIPSSGPVVDPEGVSTGIFIPTLACVRYCKAVKPYPRPQSAQSAERRPSRARVGVEIGPRGEWRKRCKRDIPPFIGFYERPYRLLCSKPLL